MNPSQLPPTHQELPPEEELPFIAPQLDDGGASKRRLVLWYVTRFTMLFLVLGMVFGGGYGVYKGITNSSKKEQPIAAVDIPTNSVAPGQDVYQGDGTDIAETVDPTVQYVCPKGYTLGDVTEDVPSKCTGEKVSTIAISSSYTCPDGYNKNGEGKGTTCSRYIGGQTITRQATVKYSCSKGYKMSGAICKKTVSTKADVVYSCPSGYTLSSTTCSKTTLTYGTVRSSCPTNFTKKGSGASATCVRVVARKSDGSCPKYYTKVIINGKKKCRRIIAATLSCDSGYTKYGTGTSTTCRKYTVSTINATATNVCPSDYSLSGSACYKTVTKSRIKKYVCSSGYTLSGSTCYGKGDGRYESTDPKKHISCKSGYRISSSRKHCEKRTHSTVPATARYSCEDGWELLPDADEPVCVNAQTQETQ